MIEREQIDPERLAALLEGRLGEAEAAAVRRQLAAAGDDTVSGFADAVAISRDLAEGGRPPATDAGTKVVPIRSARSARRWIVPAVTAVAAAIVTIIVWRPARTPDEYLPEQFARAVPASAHALGRPAWSETRSVSMTLSDSARAARIGAVLVDLEVAAARGDSTRAGAVTLVSLLDGTLGGAPLADSLRKLSPDVIAHLPTAGIRSIGRRAIALVDANIANAAAYLEAARVSTAAGDTSFFDRRPPTVLSALSGKRIDPAVADSLRAFVEKAQARPRSVPALHAAGTELLRTLTQ